MQVCKNDQARLVADVFFDLFSRNSETFLESPRKALTVSTEITDGREHRLIRWSFKQNFITGIHDRRHREVIRKRRPRSRNDRFTRHAIPRPDLFDQWRITVTTVRDLEIIERHMEIANAQIGHSTRREIE